MCTLNQSIYLPERYLFNIYLDKFGADSMRIN